MDTEWVASFDIGTKNFAFYIEEYDRQTLDNIHFPPVKARYNIDGTCTSDFEATVENMLRSSRTVLFKNTDLSPLLKEGKKDRKDIINMHIFHNMYELLDEHKMYFDRCASFVIEQQMKCNLRAIKLGQHCMSYFISRYGRFRNIVEFPAYYKTQVMGIPKIPKLLSNGKTRYLAPCKPLRKKWAVARGLAMLATRNETDIANQISKSVKKDDMCDCLVQLQAYKILLKSVD